MNGTSDSTSKPSNAVALTARQYMTGQALNALLFNLDDPDPTEEAIDRATCLAAKVANKQLAELARGRWEHKEKMARRDNTRED